MMIKNLAADFTWHAIRLRGILAVLVALCWGLRAAPQARDSLVTLGQGQSAAAWGLFVGALVWLALNTWFWARISLAIQMPPVMAHPARRRRLQLKLWFPRALFLVPFAGVSLALLGASAEIPQGMRSMMGPENSGADSLGRAAALIALLGLALLALLAAARRIRLIRIGGGVLGASSLAAGAAGMILYGFYPVTTGKILQPAPTILFATACMIAGGTVLTRLARTLHVPLLTFLAVAAIILADLRDAGIIADNHDIRTVGSPLPPRPDIAEAFAQFVAASGAHTTLGEPVPVVLVAASSGGLAAAYWTATILGDLSDTIPGFATRVFAISSVSGGSLGALETVAMLQRPKLPAGCPGIRVCTQRALSGDFLAPILGSLLFPDFLQRFVPIPIFPDRASALEKAWEARWKTVAGDDALAAPFLNLWPQKNHPWPALFLNGTSVVHGDRLLTSNIKFRSSDMDISIDAVDLLAAAGTDLPASSAVDTTTRFPLFGPVGVLRAAPAQGGTKPQAHDLVVDGGYFEDFGATTLLETLDVLSELAQRNHIKLRFIVLQIIGAPPLEAAMGGISPLPRGLWGPLDTLLHTREARGAAATHALARRVAALGGVYAPLRLGFSPTGQTAPLSWSLSPVAQHVIDAQWTKECHNQLAAEMGLTMQSAAAPHMGYAEMMAKAPCAAL